LKTLHLTNYWHATSGGIARFYTALLETANRRGQEMRLVVPSAKTWVEQVGEFGKVYHIAAPSAPLNPQYRVLYPTQFLRPGSPLQQILADERPDLVEICDKYSLNYLGALLRLGLLQGIDFKPVVVAQSCERMDDNFDSYVTSTALGRAFSTFYMKWLYFHFFDHHIANSRYTAEELRPASKSHPVQRGVWVRTPGVDADKFSPALRSENGRQQLIQQAGANPDSILLLYAGRLVPEKNLPLLIETARELAKDRDGDYRLLIAGNGIELDGLRKLAAERGSGRITFLGHIASREQLASLYANCDVFVHPNPREPFGIAPLEAMASGLALVAPNAGGVLSYANSENAWLANARDPLEFAAAVRMASNQNNERQTKLERALQTAAAFRWENVADSLFSLYDSLVEASHGAPFKEPPLFFSTSGSPSGNRLTRVLGETAKKSFAVAASWKLVPPPPTANSR
jgi:glycosyltransferase involved in cell wall biosynthesis